MVLAESALEDEAIARQADGGGGGLLFRQRCVFPRPLASSSRSSHAGVASFWLSVETFTPCQLLVCDVRVRVHDDGLEVCDVVRLRVAFRLERGDLHSG